jgi:hypothetical protein
MKRLLAFAAFVEAVLGVASLTVPSVVGRLLLGESLAGAALLVARVAGLALVGLAVACWPGPSAVGMLTYNATVALYLVYAGVAGRMTGVLLWPAVVLHLALTALLARSSLKGRARKR